MTTSRRGFFGWVVSAFAAPVVAKLPAVSEPLKPGKLVGLNPSLKRLPKTGEIVFATHTDYGVQVVESVSGGRSPAYADHFEWMRSGDKRRYEQWVYTDMALANLSGDAPRYRMSRVRIEVGKDVVEACHREHSIFPDLYPKGSSAGLAAKPVSGTEFSWDGATRAMRDSYRNAVRAANIGDLA